MGDCFKFLWPFQNVRTLNKNIHWLVFCLFFRLPLKVFELKFLLEFLSTWPSWSEFAWMKTLEKDPLLIKSLLFWKKWRKLLTNKWVFSDACWPFLPYIVLPKKILIVMVLNKSLWIKIHPNIKASLVKFQSFVKSIPHRSYLKIRSNQNRT